jgi:hypothetical protein
MKQVCRLYQIQRRPLRDAFSYHDVVLYFFLCDAAVGITENTKAREGIEDDLS